ncbi:putative damage-inducible protein DinB [Anoxybacillus vitaminiphilus]|uniref:Putative damage-inducible protein DinB n=1 Tax=Paranoxybacillus vitaminiphilus TaxID=581036 RepID=A0A327YS70_9BACL|nr:DinB family protein [Anoxybacillus vitaminiphilus]RAK23166.1 putative damage-inducible protein DinB [Anoxybacillus vitaminiphilus]
MKQIAMKLVQYHCWATEKLLNYLQRLPHSVLTLPINSVFPNIESVLVHMLAVDELWLERMKGNEHIEVEGKYGWPVKQFILAYVRFFEDLRNFVSDVEDVSAVVSYTNDKGERRSNTILEIIYHIVNDGTYYRGNISAVLHQAGYNSIATDYIHFLKENEAKS